MRLFAGDGLRSRALRGTAITFGGTAGQQMLRLISNLVLTRLLFPEAFGLMALIQTFMTGLQMFSDLGLRPSIMQNARGEDPDFLNTAWTIQIGRGVGLWLASCAMAWPLASFYGDRQILWIMPVVGLNALIQGFGTTKAAVANRHIRLGRQTVIGLATQAAGLVVMTGLAFVWPSVWALVVGALISSGLGVWAGHHFMPGQPNRIRWDRSAARDLMNFGRFIFVSTIAGFFVNQGDKLFLGKMVSLADLGIYNIGFFMSAFPGMLGGMVAERILFPLYRQIRPSESAQNFAKIRYARTLMMGALVTMFGGMALIGDLVVGLLYDDRYAAAGPMLIILALAQLPNALIMGSSALLLAEGNSRDFSRLVIIKGVLNFVYMFAGFWLFGIFGILLVQGLNILSIYPLQQYFLNKHKAMDLQRDAMFAALAVALAVLAIGVNRNALQDFYVTSRALAPSVTGSWHPASVFAAPETADRTPAETAAQTPAETPAKAP